MAALASLLVFCQALGALGGALAAVYGELAYVRALRDGVLDAAERAHLRAIGGALKFGMTLLLLASIGLVVIAYIEGAATAPALTASYWTFMALALLIISVTWALSKKYIAFSIGSATVFTAWWFLAYLSLGRLPALSFGAALAFYIVAAAILYAILRYARMLIAPAS